jgi:hypothetical protein
MKKTDWYHDSIRKLIDNNLNCFRAKPSRYNRQRLFTSAIFSFQEAVVQALAGFEGDEEKAAHWASKCVNDTLKKYHRLKKEHE